MAETLPCTLLLARMFRFALLAQQVQHLADVFVVDVDAELAVPFAVDGRSWPSRAVAETPRRVRAAGANCCRRKFNAPGTRELPGGGGVGTGAGAGPAPGLVPAEPPEDAAPPASPAAAGWSRASQRPAVAPRLAGEAASGWSDTDAGGSSGWRIGRHADADGQSNADRRE